ncbi:hypothetical protein [Flavobacterium psychrophilum]|nr:hypothetical protein [Flavobacterium psychrophilum]MCB6089147.1 hypothetical protein [Flavobacterium psychrophilum]MCB6231846.1 hypothetical protein [Flavobacterium psychrophilum]MEB3380320.1 hypothetical protein [Flavobacterium psychrophilum]SNA77754.1 hypothetical protein DK095_460184 [Flavobacterium psychrophilum]SNA87962.1 hypothetical protein FI146_70006 [Flavobacterium psychrophilum]
MAINFANKLSEFVKPYELEFEKRNWKCEKRTGNLPYWSLDTLDLERATETLHNLFSHLV